MFERFTERARQVIVLAQDEARALKHNYIGTEHILLGLLREEEGLACRVLDGLDVTTDEVRREVKRIVGEGDVALAGQIPITPRAKKALELGLREALSLGHNYIGTEHVLLGLVREGEGVAMRILLDFDVTAEMVRDAIISRLSGPARKKPEATQRKVAEAKDFPPDVERAMEVIGDLLYRTPRESAQARESYIQTLRIAVLTEAAEALKACALVLERAAASLVEES